MDDILDVTGVKKGPKQFPNVWLGTEIGTCESFGPLDN